RWSSGPRRAVPCSRRRSASTRRRPCAPSPSTPPTPPVRSTCAGRWPRAWSPTSCCSTTTPPRCRARRLETSRCRRPLWRARRRTARSGSACRAESHPDSESRAHGRVPNERKSTCHVRGTCLVDRRCEPNVAGESGRCAMRDAVRELLDAVDGRSDAMERAATTLLDCIDAGGVVHTAGAGHSVAMVCETFYRAGGLAAVRPLWDPEVVPLDGALRSTAAEREIGRGRTLVEKAAPAAPDVVVVFST